MIILVIKIGGHIARCINYSGFLLGAPGKLILKIRF